MTAPFLLPVNALVAADRLRAYTTPARVLDGRAARRAALRSVPAAPAPTGFRARASFGTFARTLRTDTSRMTWHGRTGSHDFEVLSADAAAALSGPVVLVAKRWGADARAEIAAVEAFEAENAARLRAWVARAAVAGVQLQVCRGAGTRAARAAIVADLVPTAPRACPFVSAGAFNRSAIMAAAVASARLLRTETGAAWASCLSTALREVWTVARLARLASAH